MVNVVYLVIENILKRIFSNLKEIKTTFGVKIVTDKVSVKIDLNHFDGHNLTIVVMNINILVVFDLTKNLVKNIFNQNSKNVVKIAISKMVALVFYFITIFYFNI